MSNILTDDQPQQDNFLAEAEIMDLSSIRDKQFLVAVGTGDPNSVKFLPSTIHGPFSFVEMCQEVGDMYVNHQHHARVIIPCKDSSKPVEVLDENTIDYIECHYTDIITEEMLGGAFDEKPFTCKAGTSTKTNQPDPRHEKKKVEETSDAESDNL